MPEIANRPFGNSSGPTFESQQRYWDERWNCHRRPNAWQLKRANTVLSMVRSLRLKSKPKVLDLGCATGWFTAELANIGDVTGIDLSQAAI